MAEEPRGNAATPGLEMAEDCLLALLCNARPLCYTGTIGEQRLDEDPHFISPERTISQIHRFYFPPCTVHFPTVCKVGNGKGGFGFSPIEGDK